MNESYMLWILIGMFIISMAWVVGYFFVHRPRQIDKDYEKFRTYWK